MPAQSLLRLQCAIGIEFDQDTRAVERTTIAHIDKYAEKLTERRTPWLCISQ